MPLRVARNASEVYENANPEAILLVLMHKISQAAAADGLHDARSLLQSWLAAVCAKHNLHRASSTGQTVDSLEQVDSCLPACLPKRESVELGFTAATIQTGSEPLRRDRSCTVLVIGKARCKITS